MALLKRRPSPSMIVALVALFFALTGWGVAGVVALTPNSVGTQQIVNHSIRLADLHPSAVKGLRGLTGPQGETGETGATGPVGPAGPAGGFDPAKVAYVGSGSVTAVQYTIATAIASCPAGSKVIGGSAQPGAGSIVGMGPTADHAGWAVVVGNGSSLATITFSAGAICASP